MQVKMVLGDMCPVTLGLEIVVVAHNSVPSPAASWGRFRVLACQSLSRLSSLDYRRRRSLDVANSIISTSGADHTPSRHAHE